MRTHMYLTIFPGVAIMLSILAFNILGDGIVMHLILNLEKGV